VGSNDPLPIGSLNNLLYHITDFMKKGSIRTDYDLKLSDGQCLPQILNQKEIQYNAKHCVEIKSFKVKTVMLLNFLSCF